MFKVISGITEQRVNKWLKGSVKISFDYKAKPSWFDDDIVRQELREVEKVVDVIGMVLVKEDGSTIPINWLSQGTKQFIMMTQYPDKVYDAFYFGWNVYKYFYLWSKERGVDVTVLMFGTDSVKVPELEGYFINTGESFSSGDELSYMIACNRCVVLSDTQEDGSILSRKFRQLKGGDIEEYGKISKIFLNS